MGDQKMTDFVVESSGLCFFCLSKICSSHVTAKAESSSSQVQSLQFLSRYLKIDMTRVFNETDAVTPELLAKVERSTLKVQLCKECTCLNETFSKLYRQLEKIELGAKSCVNLIKSKLSNVKKNNAIKAGYQFGMNPVDGFDGKLRIMEVLRSETEEKCSGKLGAEPPLIKLQKLSLKQVQRKRLKITKSSNPQKIPRSSRGLDDVSFQNLSDGNGENQDFNSDLITDDNDANSHFDNYYYESNQQESEKATKNCDIIGDAMEQMTATPTTNKPRITIDKAVYTISTISGKYKCNLCGKEMKNFDCFKRHYEGLHLKIKYKCSRCGKQFQSKTNYNRHVQTAHMGIRFSCKTCGKSYAQKYYLQTHQRLKSCGVGGPSSSSVKNEVVS